jgi:hypothetical protein
MNMRSKKRAQLATWTPPSGDEAEVLAALTQVRQARIALLRKPGALREVKNTIKRIKGPATRVLRKMLAEDLKLMRRIDRAARTIASV